MLFARILCPRLTTTLIFTSSQLHPWTFIILKSMFKNVSNVENFHRSERAIALLAGDRSFRSSIGNLFWKFSSFSRFRLIWEFYFFQLVKIFRFLVSKARIKRNPLPSEQWLLSGWGTRGNGINKPPRVIFKRGPYQKRGRFRLQLQFRCRTRKKQRQWIRIFKSVRFTLTVGLSHNKECFRLGISWPGTHKDCPRKNWHNFGWYIGSLGKWCRIPDVLSQSVKVNENCVS